MMRENVGLNFGFDVVRMIVEIVDQKAEVRCGEWRGRIVEVG